MNRHALWLTCAVGLVSVFLCSSAGAQPSAVEITDGIQKFYSNTKDYQASFEQVFTDVAAGDEIKRSGRVFFKKPGKMRWDYLKKENNKTVLEKVLVSDGKAFTIYEPAANQYFRKCLKDSTLPTALSFLVGEGDLAKDFTPAKRKARNADTYEVELTPKKSSGQYKKLVFVVDKTTFRVKEAVVYDPYGNTNRLSFTKPLINKKLPDSGFIFPPPKGARPVGNVDAKCD